MTKKKFRLSIFTTDEPHFVLPAVSDLCEQLADDAVITSFVISTFLKSDSLAARAKRLYPLMGCKGTALTAFDVFRFKIAAWFGSSRRSLTAMAARYGARVHYVNDVNAPDFIETWSAENPDLGVSISFGHILKPSVLKIPHSGVINAHSSLLPKNQGLMPIFWAMYRREPATGVTVHYIDPGIDTGGIIAQHQFDLPPGITYHQAAATAKQLAVRLIASTVRRMIRGESVPGKPQGGEPSYNRFPTTEEFKAFRAMGCRYR
jgi:folate-dependent phosphoribosylglycinamide formyltransferase PurN